MKRIIPSLGAVLLFLCGTVYAQSNCPARTIQDCPDTGCGGWDREFDRKRNLTGELKSQTPRQMTLEQILRLSYPTDWFAGKDRSGLATLGEGTIVQVTGYLVGVKPGRISSANCRLTGGSALNDLLFLVAQDAVPKKIPAKKTLANKVLAQLDAISVTAEITARVRLQRFQQAGGKNWSRDKLTAWISRSPNKARLVRITGQLLPDPEHIYNPMSRATDWQIHPVLEIEVCDKGNSCIEGQGWKELITINIKTSGVQRPKGPIIRPKN
jgi:hypothetical protein